MRHNAKSSDGLLEYLEDIIGSNKYIETIHKCGQQVFILPFHFCIYFTLKFQIYIHFCSIFVPYLIYFWLVFNALINLILYFEVLNANLTHFWPIFNAWKCIYFTLNFWNALHWFLCLFLLEIYIHFWVVFNALILFLFLYVKF